MTATQDAPTTAVLHSRFPGSRKAYIAGPRSDMRIPTREVALTPSEGRFGDGENAAVRFYDTSEPYTDPDAHVDIRSGLPALRRPWVLERNDVEEYDSREPQAIDIGGPRANAEMFPGLIRRPLRTGFVRTSAIGSPVSPGPASSSVAEFMAFAPPLRP